MFQIDKQFANANISRTIRFTETIFNELNAVADENNISFNMLVLQSCRYALDHLQRDDPTAEELSENGKNPTNP